jgi:hypothetical protein
MKLVANLLEGAKVGEFTIDREEDIIKTLQEMVDALKKARDDNKKKKGGKGGGGGSGKKADEKLIKLVQELKMVKSLQLKINYNTAKYGKDAKGNPLPQAIDPIIQKYLQDLSNNQEKLFDITKKLAKGDNQ